MAQSNKAYDDLRAQGFSDDQLKSIFGNINMPDMDNSESDWERELRETGVNFSNALSNILPDLNKAWQATQASSIDLLKSIGGEDFADFLVGDYDEFMERKYDKIQELDLARKETGGIVKGIRAGGDFSDIAGGMFNAVTSLVTTMAPAVLTRGLSLVPQIAAPMVADYNITKAKTKYKDSDDPMRDLIEDDEVDFAVPATLGLFAASMERIGIKGITNYIAKQSFKGKGAVMLLNTASREGLTESGQFFTEQLNTNLAEGMDKGEAAWKAFQSISSDEGIESFLQGFVGGAAVGGVSRKVSRALRNDDQGSKMVMNSIRTLAALNDQKKKEPSTAARKILDDDIAKVEANIKNYMNDNRKLAELLGEDQKQRLEKLIDDKDALRSRVKELQQELQDGKITQQAYNGYLSSESKKYTKINEDIAAVKNEVDINIAETQRKAVEEAAEIAGNKVQDIDSDQKEALLKKNGFKGQKLKDAKDTVAGIYNPNDGILYLDMETALEVGEINVAGHELLHPIFNKLIGDPAKQGKIVEDFKKQLTQKELEVMEQEMLERGYTLENGKYNTEYINVFSDSITKGLVGFNDGVFSKVGDVITGLFKGVGFKNISFDSGRGVYNFLKAYHEGLDAGKFNEDVLTFIEKTKDIKDPLGTIATSQVATPLEAINNLVPKTIKTKSDYEGFISDPKNNAKMFESIYSPGGVINNYIRSRQTSQQEGDKTIENTIDRILNFNPEATRADGSVVGIEGFGEAIFANTRFAKLDARKELAIETERQKMEGGDMELATKVIAQEKADDTLDQPKAKSKPRKPKVDPTTFDGIPAKISLKYETDQKPTKAREKLKNKPDKELTVKEISVKYAGVIGEQIFNIPADKITAAANNLTLQDARNIQQFFGRSDNLSRSLSILPEFNVATNVTQVGLEKLDVPKNIKGISLGINDTILDLAYEDYVDPKGEMTTPKGRSKGATSQTPVKRLKPEFRGTITKKTLDAVRSKIGITPSGELNMLPKGAERSSIGQSLKGMAKIFSQLTAATLIRKASPKAPAKELIPSKAGLRDVQFSTGVRKQFDLKLKGKLKVDTLLTDNGLDKSLDLKEEIKTPEGRKRIVKMLKDNVVILGPKEMWIGPRGGSVFTTSGADFGISMKTTDGKRKNANNEYLNPTESLKLEELRNMISDMLNDKSTKFGPPIKGVNDYTLSSYGTIFKGSAKDIKTKSKAFNKKIGLIHKALWTRINKQISKDKKSASGIATYLKLTANHTGHWHKLGAQISGYSPNIKGTKYEYEHAMPATAAYLYLLDASLTKGRPFAKSYKLVMDNYKLIALDNADNKKLGLAKLARTMPDGWDILNNKWWERYFNEAVAKQQGGIDPNTILDLDGITFAKSLNIDNSGNKVTNNAIDELTQATEANNEILPKQTGQRLSTDGTIDKMQTIDAALQTSRAYNKPTKGITVLDFDDTVAISNSKVIVNMPDGKTKKITPAEFALESENLEAEGAKFDFSEFNKVVRGRKGPLFDLALKRQAKFGNKDIFILTARPQASALAIQKFAKGLGLNLRLENITGLENGTPQAKADWITGKVAEGYNDFYFADDAIKNVKAVQKVLDVADVKSDVQQAIIQFSKGVDKEFNKILEEKSGVKAEARFSDAAAKSRGIKSLPWYKRWFIPPSAEDFVGLLYHFTPSGKRGEQAMDFFKKTLIDPFARAYKNINAAKQVLANEFDALQKQYPGIKKLYNKDTGYNNFTNEQAIRVYIWNKNGFEIPGISKRDLSALTKIVEDNSDMKAFANKLGKITKLPDGYIKPSENWTAETIGSDIVNVSNKENRGHYMKEFIDNKEIIFSKDNLNKIEAIYGTDFRSSLEDMLWRMENGSNRRTGQSKLVNRWFDWVNNSVGAIMFFNFRSAVLQTISAVNFVNWSDNNPLKAGAALANAPQYAKDFAFIFNSDMLKQRRAGLQTDVNASELANSIANKKDKVNATIAFLLKKGFLPTQMADSFAIASGGATFYRNRINTYKKQGFTDKEAESKAFKDFQEISEVSQQSSRPDLISEQQAGPLGRLILAFQNTPMQYTRLMKKAALDLKNRRGDDKTNISKIIYYGAVQNIIFTAMQNAMFGLLFEDEEEKGDDRYDKKKARMLNSMADTILRGIGVYGAAVSTIKNVALKFIQEEGDGRPNHTYTLIEAINLSPPIGSKARKIYTATQTYTFNKDEIKEKGFALDSPAYGAVGNVISAGTNIPTDRVYNILNNAQAALDKNNKAWQRIAVALGWNTWDVGIERKKFEKDKKEIKELNPLQKRIEAIKRAEARKKKKK